MLEDSGIRNTPPFLRRQCFCFRPRIELDFGSASGQRLRAEYFLDFAHRWFTSLLLLLRCRADGFDIADTLSQIFFFFCHIPAQFYALRVYKIFARGRHFIYVLMSETHYSRCLLCAGMIDCCYSQTLLPPATF